MSSSSPVVAGNVLHRLPPFARVLLALLVFSAFLTETKFVPSLRNNVGLFEVTGASVVGWLLLTSGPGSLKAGTLTKLAFALLGVAAVSQVNIAENRTTAGLVNVAILAFFALFLLAVENLSARHRIHPVHLLRLVAWALMIVGPWIVSQGLQADWDIQDAGPFRNRAHMGNYMLTAFWLSLAYSQVPRLPRLERWVGYLGVGMTLYAVAVSGRRSVYLSLFIGLATLFVAFLVASRQKRLELSFGILFALGCLALMYTLGNRGLPQFAFFQERVSMIDDRLRSALVVDEEAAVEQTFFAAQREGIRAAFTAHPLIGIGWGGYAKSHWSPDRHEVHSTPLRFLAETGLAGFVLYVAFMAVLWWTAWSLFVRLRSGPWGAVAFVLLVGLSSLAVSYLYNRHITERTFWLFLAVVLAFRIRLEQEAPAPERGRSAAARGAARLTVPHPAAASPDA